MGKVTRVVLGLIAVVVVVVVLAAVALPMFLNADSFRTRIESTLSKSLGRTVTIGKLQLSVWSGGLVAEHTAVADDPRFSTQPFLQAETVKIGVELFPLILRREVRIRSFSLESPKIQLLRGADGLWNYSSIGGGANKAANDADTKQAFPDLTVGHVEVVGGQISVGSGPGVTGSTGVPTRIYEQVNLDVKNFGFTTSFPFKASAHLPGDGTVDVSGTAGPINQQDASATPFSGHLELKHIDPLAAGFVDASAGISGQVDAITLDASWSGQALHVTKLLVDTPHITVVRNTTPKAAPAANPEGSTMLQNLSVDSAQVKNGTVTLTSPGQAGAPAVYQQLNAEVTNLSPKSFSPFTVSAQLPGGGSLNASGKAGPFDMVNTAATPIDAQVSLKHVELETSGILAPDAGISGLANLDAKIQSNGQTLNANGTAQIDQIKLAKNGQPSSKPVNAQFTVTQDERARTGTIQRATVGVGALAIAINGTYQTSGKTTALNLKVNGNALPINDLEAFLPALGVHLPQGSRLQGGTVTTALTVSGSTANPVISGPVQINNTQLTGFNLGAKLQDLAKFTGGRIGSSTGSGTTVRSLSMVIQESDGAIRTDKIALDVVGLGTATGAGSVSAAGALDYNVLLKLTGLMGSGSTAAASNAGGGGAAGVGGLIGGLTGLIPGAGGAQGLGSLGGLAGGVLRNGLPVAIGGTTSNPTFAPNLRGLATGIGASAAQNLLGGKAGHGTPSKEPSAQQLGNALGGLFGRH